MCGISLLVEFGNENVKTSQNQLLEAIAHRGPDHQNVNRKSWSNGNIITAVARLRIVDSDPNSDQPLRSSDGRFELMFNGEIYNFQDLKNDLLIQGIDFNSHSDSEVLLHWLIQNKEKGIKNLKGMYAFTFIDYEKEEIICSRDRFGIKPLYYANSEDYVVVSSEIKGILASGKVSRDIEFNQVSHYLAYNYPSSPHTFYSHIQEVQAGHILKINRNGVSSFKVHFDPIQVGANTSIVTHIKQLITDSILNQLHCRQPLGLMLSGGVDSTLIWKIARSEEYNIQSFNLSFPEAENDESKHVKQFAEDNDIRLTTFEFKAQDFNEYFPNFVNDLDQPIADPGAFANWFLMKNASREVKVLISGAGADELFAGYNRHFAYYKYLKNYDWVTRLMPMAGFAFKVLEKMPISSAKSRLWKKLMMDFSYHPTVTFDHFISSYLSKRSYEKWENDFKDKQAFIEHFMKNALDNDVSNYLVHDVLAITDRMSMVHGVEVRVPYINEELYYYLKKIKASDKISKGRKWILREILSELGEDKIANRPKRGFGPPLAYWLRNDMIPALTDILKDEKAEIFKFLHKDCFDYLAVEHNKGQQDYSREIWSVGLLAHWLKARTL